MFKKRFRSNMYTNTTFEQTIGSCSGDSRTTCSAKTNESISEKQTYTGTIKCKFTSLTISASCGMAEDVKTTRTCAATSEEEKEKITYCVWSKETDAIVVKVILPVNS